MMDRNGKDFIKVKEILDRWLHLRKVLCDANCKVFAHVDACKMMKKDIQFVKDRLL
jgi:regulator of sigma D